MQSIVNVQEMPQLPLFARIWHARLRSKGAIDKGSFEDKGRVTNKCNQKIMRQIQKDSEGRSQTSSRTYLFCLFWDLFPKWRSGMCQLIKQNQAIVLQIAMLKCAVHYRKQKGNCQGTHFSFIALVLVCSS